MQLSGTLPCEIIKPVGETWKSFADRAHVMRRTLRLALNFAFRDVYPGAIRQLEQLAQGERPVDTSWQGNVRKRLRAHWNQRIEAQGEYKKRTAKKDAVIDARTFAPVLDCLCSETSDHILSRFHGEHLKALLAGRAGTPNISSDCFYSEGRQCSVSGEPGQDATLRFPLWGSGSRATTLIVAPCGAGHEALWRRIVHSNAERERIVELERQASERLPPEADKEAGVDEKALALKLRAEARARRQAAVFELEELHVVKLGRVGIKYNSRRKKWFAQISYTIYQPDAERSDRVAVCNFGIQCFVKSLTEDGTEYEDRGGDILATRTRYSQRRRSLQCQSYRRGQGARGHGVKRREKPLQVVADRESRWVQQRIRQSASDYRHWCKRNGIGLVYLEDLTGIREDFEQRTEGQADAELKRWIHHWPFAETQKAYERELIEHGVRVEYKSTLGISMRCPKCQHEAPENVTELKGDWTKVPDRMLAQTLTEALDGDYRVLSGHLYRMERPRRWFKCVKCLLKGDVDLIACANHLLDVGHEHALGKMQSAARKRSRGRRKGVTDQAAE